MNPGHTHPRGNAFTSRDRSRRSGAGLWLVICAGLITLAAIGRGATVTVQIFDYYFTPTNITVQPGDTVTWINRSGTAHDTTQYDPATQDGFLWMSDVFGRGESFSFTFSNPGVFPYICATHFFTHPEQTGTVTVAQMNLAPSVHITAPASNASFTVSSTFTVTAGATDSDGNVVSVQFFANGSPIGIGQPPDFTAQVSGLPAGGYNLTALATDNGNATTLSDPVPITIVENTPNTFPLAIAVSPADAGTVTVDPPQPQGGYNAGATVTLTAVPNSGFSFSNWTGSASGSQNPLTITMNSAMSVTANFTAVPTVTHTLAVSANPADGGSVQVSPAANGANGSYVEGTVVTLTASAGANHAFAGWTGAVEAATNPLVLTVTADLSVSANFTNTTVPTHVLTLVTNPPGGGSITAAPAPNGSGGGYLEGTVVLLTATAAAGNSFSGWSGAAAGTEAQVSVTMDADKTVTASFAAIPVTNYVLTLVTNPARAGSISASPTPGPGGTYRAGTTVTLTATGAGTNIFTNWSGAVTGSSNRISLVMDSDKSVTANFVPLIPPIPPRYTLVVSSSPTNAGTVTVNPLAGTNGTYSSNTTAALAAIANHGFRFAHWSGASSSTNNPIVITMTGDKSVTAVFEDLPAVDFSTLAGAYNGLIVDGRSVSAATAGSLNVRLSASGAYRGIAVLGGIRQFVAGQFDRFGYAPFTLRRGSLSGSLQIDAAGTKMTGTLTDGKKAPDVLLYRTGMATNAAALAGTYLLSIAPTNAVQRAGTVTMTLSPRGLVRIHGTLGDATPFAERTALTPDGRVSIMAVLYGGRGVLAGWLDLSPEAVTGNVQWVRPPNSRSHEFPDGLAIEVPVTGQRQ